MASLSTCQPLDIMGESSSNDVLQLHEVHIKEEAFDPDDDSFGADYNAFHDAISAEMERAEESRLINGGNLTSMPIKSEPDVNIEVNSSERSTGLVYRCKYCGQQLQKIETLLQHEDAHRNGTIYKCRYCEYYAMQRDRIRAHECKHTGEKPYSCDLCDYTCASQGDLRKHMKTHSSVKKYRCPLCPFRSKLASGINKHMKVHSEDRPFHCDKCEWKFKRKYALENHMKLHSTEKPFKCDKCSYTCKTKNLLRLHVKTHSEVRNFACSHEGCQQRCKTRSDLVKHMVVHVKALDFKCVMCNKMFKSKQRLLVHTRRHVRKEFPCPECGKMITGKQGLARHMSLHFQEKKHSCHICGHKFSSTFNLKNHIKVHDESRTFQCPLCVSGYETANHLFTHIGSAHGKGYVYFCELCHKPFSRYIMIKTHIERNHRKTDGNERTHEEFVYNEQCCESSAIRIPNDGGKIPFQEDNVKSFGKETVIVNSSSDHQNQRELEVTEALPLSSNLIDHVPVKIEGESNTSASLMNTSSTLSAIGEAHNVLEEECRQSEDTDCLQSGRGNSAGFNATGVSEENKDPHTSLGGENVPDLMKSDENHSPEKHAESDLMMSDDNHSSEKHAESDLIKSVDNHSSEKHAESDLMKSDENRSPDNHPESDLIKSDDNHSSEKHAESDLMKSDENRSPEKHAESDLMKGDENRSPDKHPESDLMKSDENHSPDNHPESNLMKNDENHSPDKHPESELCRRKLIVKLERLPESSFNGSGSLSNSNPCDNVVAVEENFDKIVRLGTYASVGIFLAGKNAGMKFNFKRGKKSNFSKWFMNPSHMTPYAAERTKLYLKNQVKLSLQSKEKPQRRRRRKKSHCKTQSPKVSLSSTSSPGSRRQKKGRKKLPLRKEKTPVSLQSSSAVENEGRAFTQTLSTTDVDQTLSYHLQEDYKNFEIVNGSQMGELQDNFEQSCDDRVVSVKKSPRKNTVKRKQKTTMVSARKRQKLSPELTELPSVNENVSAPAMPKGQGVENGDSDILSVFHDGSFSGESKPVDEGLTINGKGCQLQPESSAGETSVVLGVEKVKDSPIKITWKKVGFGRKARCNQTQVFNPRLNRMKSEISSSKRYKVVNDGSNSVNPINRQVEQSVITEQTIPPIPCDIGNISSDRDASMNKTTSDSHPMVGKSNRVKTQLEEDHNLPNRTECCESTNFEREEQNHSVKEPRVQVMSLQEFEEEYRKRPKIVAKVSLVQGEIEKDLEKDYISVNRKRKKLAQKKDSSPKRRKKPGKKSAQEQAEQFSSLQNEIFQADTPSDPSDCTAVRKSSYKDSDNLFPPMNESSRTGIEFEGANPESKQKKPRQSGKSLKPVKGGKLKNSKRQAYIDSTNLCNESLGDTDTGMSESQTKVNSVYSKLEMSNQKINFSSVNLQNKSLHCTEGDEMETNRGQQISSSVMGKREKSKPSKKSFPHLSVDIPIVPCDTTHPKDLSNSYAASTSSEKGVLSGPFNFKKKKKNQPKDNPPGNAVISVGNKNWTIPHFNFQGSTTSGGKAKKISKRKPKEIDSQGTPTGLSGQTMVKKNKNQHKKKASGETSPKKNQNQGIEKISGETSPKKNQNQGIEKISGETSLKKNQNQGIEKISGETSPKKNQNQGIEKVSGETSLKKNKNQGLKKTSGETILKKNQSQGRKKVKNGAHRPLSKENGFPFTTAGSTLNSNAAHDAGSRIKLPGLMSKDFDLRRQTVECVTLLPKVVLSGLKSMTNIPPNSSDQTLPKSCPMPENQSHLWLSNSAVNENMVSVSENCDAQHNEVKVETSNNPWDFSQRITPSLCPLTEFLPDSTPTTVNIVVEKNCDVEENGLKEETPNSPADFSQQTLMSSCSLLEDVPDLSTTTTTMTVNVNGKNCDDEDNEVKTETANDPSDSPPETHLGLCSLPENQPDLSFSSSSTPIVIAANVIKANLDDEESEISTEILNCSPSNYSHQGTLVSQSPCLLPGGEPNFSPSTSVVVNVVEKKLDGQETELKIDMPVYNPLNSPQENIVSQCLPPENQPGSTATSVTVSEVEGNSDIEELESKTNIPNDALNSPLRTAPNLCLLHENLPDSTATSVTVTEVEENLDTEENKNELKTNIPNDALNSPLSTAPIQRLRPENQPDLIASTSVTVTEVERNSNTEEHESETALPS